MGIDSDGAGIEFLLHVVEEIGGFSVDDIAFATLGFWLLLLAVGLGLLTGGVRLAYRADRGKPSKGHVIRRWI